MLWLIAGLLIVVIVQLLILLLRKPGEEGSAAVRSALADAESRQRMEQQAALAAQLAPVNAALGRVQSALAESRDAILREQAEKFAESFASLTERLEQALRLAREEQLGALQKGREEQAKNSETLAGRVERRLEAVQKTSERKLEEVRLTVDERLQATLEKRLTESFQRVQESLDKVQRGLGEMQTLAQDVGGLKRVLSGVKTRGILGEAQLGALIADHLTTDQFRAQASVGDGREAVDFAVRLPGPDESPVWLPIDAKFPTEDYDRLRAAQDAGDAAAVKASEKALETRLVTEAKRIQSKYLLPPQTTDFAVMFLPSEGLYAEALRLPGLFQRLQLDQRVTIAGPTTLSALLNALRVGFRTLAISKQSAEVWRVLADVKTEFGKFGQWLDSVNKKIAAAGKEMEQLATRTKAMDRKLRTVEALPSSNEPPLTARELPLGAPDDEDDEAPHTS